MPLLAAISVEGHSELLYLVMQLKEIAGCEALPSNRVSSAWVRQSWPSFKRTRLSTPGAEESLWRSVGTLSHALLMYESPLTDLIIRVLLPEGTDPEDLGD